MRNLLNEIIVDSWEDLGKTFNDIYHKISFAKPEINIEKDKYDVLFIDVAVPGYDKENINVEIKGNSLYISGKAAKSKDRHVIAKNIFSDDFERSILLDENYASGEIDAIIENGILRIVVRPKKPFSNKINIK
jgi:HSP20 family protein